MDTKPFQHERSGVQSVRHHTMQYCYYLLGIRWMCRWRWRRQRQRPGKHEKKLFNGACMWYVFKMYWLNELVNECGECLLRALNVMESCVFCCVVCCVKRIWNTHTKSVNERNNETKNHWAATQLSVNPIRWKLRMLSVGRREKKRSNHRTTALANTPFCKCVNKTHTANKNC